MVNKKLIALGALAYAGTQIASGGAAGGGQQQQKPGAPAAMGPPGLGLGIPGAGSRPGTNPGPNINFEAPEVEAQDTPQVRYVPANPQNTGTGGTQSTTSTTSSGSDGNKQGNKGKSPNTGSSTTETVEVPSQPSKDQVVDDVSQTDLEPAPQPTDAMTGVGPGGQEIIDPAVHGKPVQTVDSGSNKQKSSKDKKSGSSGGDWVDFVPDDTPLIGGF